MKYGFIGLTSYEKGNSYMKKFINKAENFVNETISGLIKAHSSQIELLENNPRVLLRTDKKEKGEVAVVSAGGSGHLPLFLGYVGKGILMDVQ